MSARAYMLAARDAIRTALDLDAASCEVMFDGEPKPSCGEEFVAVHPGEWTGVSMDADLSEQIGFQVTLTRRLGFSPQDRWGPEVWAKETEGVEARLRLIILALHKKYAVMNVANSTYVTATYPGFCEPVLFLDGGQPVPRGPDWFNSSSERTTAGISQTLTFGRALRVQGLAPTYDIS